MNRISTSTSPDVREPSPRVFEYSTYVVTLRQHQTQLREPMCLPIISG